MRQFIRIAFAAAAFSLAIASAHATPSYARAVGGPPAFAQPVEYDRIASGAQYVVAGDVLHRGIDDLIVTHANDGYGYVSFLRNNGDGTFGAPRLVFQGSINTQVKQAHLADLSGTGRQDLVMVTETDGGSEQITTAINDGNGNFTVGSQTFVFGGPIVIGKFGPNTRDDVFVQAAYALPSMLLLSNGSGGFQVSQYASGGGNGGLIPVPGAGGHLNLIGIGQSTDPYHTEELQTLVGIGSSPYFNAPIYSPPSLLETIITGYNSGVSAAAGDLRGDGNADLLVFGSDGQWGMSIAASVYLGNPDGTFDPPLLVPINTTRAFGNSAVIADLNGDGIEDIFMTTADAGAPMGAYAMRGIGDGTFPLPLQSFLPFYPLYPHVALGNLKGGGLPDLVVSDQLGGNGVWVLLNNTPKAR